MLRFSFTRLSSTESVSFSGSGLGCSSRWSLSAFCTICEPADTTGELLSSSGSMKSGVIRFVAACLNLSNIDGRDEPSGVLLERFSRGPSTLSDDPERRSTRRKYLIRYFQK